MSGFYIVPDALYDAIQKKLDAAIAVCPEAEKDRDHLYHQLLEAFGKYGSIPDFTLEQVPAMTAREAGTYDEDTQPPGEEDGD